MRNFLFNLRTVILAFFGLASPVLIGTTGFHATAECQKRPEFVVENLQRPATVVATRHDRAIEDARQVPTSSAGRKATRFWLFDLAGEPLLRVGNSNT